MRFLIDECCPRAFAEVLRKAGHEVAYAAEMAASTPDADLAELARREQRLVVTQDYDFGELAVRYGLPIVGLVLVACPTLSTKDRAERLRLVVAELADKLSGVLAVIEPKRVRLRDIKPGD